MNSRLLNQESFAKNNKFNRGDMQFVIICQLILSYDMNSYTMFLYRVRAPK